MIVSLLITFLLILILVIISIQNDIPLDMEFLIWNFQMSLTALIFYSSVGGAAIVAVLTLPKLVTKSLQARKMNKELAKWKERSAELEEARKLEKT